jgi:hypothetical protein|tara:strand:- start:138 stop:371 length:234 start_codon:yes stop_codon:yes gene_type:complete
MIFIIICLKPYFTKHKEWQYFKLQKEQKCAVIRPLESFEVFEGGKQILNKRLKLKARTFAGIEYSCNLKTSCTFIFS